MHRTVSFFYSLFLALILFVSATVLIWVSENNSSFPKVVNLDKGNGKVTLMGSSLPIELSDVESAGKTVRQITVLNRTLFPEPLCDGAVYVVKDIGCSAKDLLISVAGLIETIITQNA